MIAARQRLASKTFPNEMEVIRITSRARSRMKLPRSSFTTSNASTMDSRRSVSRWLHGAQTSTDPRASPATTYEYVYSSMLEKDGAPVFSEMDGTSKPQEMHHSWAEQTSSTVMERIPSPITRVPSQLKGCQAPL